MDRFDTTTNSGRSGRDIPDAFKTLLARFTDIISEYLAYQVEAGADVVQVFDTYTGTLSPADHREFILPLHQRILRDITVPSIIFVRNLGSNSGFCRRVVLMS